MNEQRIEELKNGLRQIMQLISARGEPLSEEMKAQLAQVIEHVANRIQQLRQEEQQPAEQMTPAPPEQPQVEGAPHASSNINGFNYDYDNQRLLVKFQDKYPSQNGPIYAYEGVPKFIFDIFRKGAVAPKTSGKNRWHRWERGVTPSHGAAMYHLIRDNYPYQKVG